MFDRFFNPKGKVLVKGPSVRWASKIYMDFDGVRISFKAPRHGGVDSIYKQEHFIEKISISDLAQPNSMTESGWPRCQYLGVRYWGFKGPYLSGELAMLTFGIKITRQKPDSEYYSLFDPDVFVRAIKEDLTSNYSHHVRLGHQESIAPVHWKRYSKALPAVSLDVMSNPKSILKTSNIESSRLYIAITDDCYVCFFGDYQFNAEVDPSNMKLSCDFVFDSIDIEFSGQKYTHDHLKLYKKSAESLPENVPSLKWVTPEQEAFFRAYELFDKASNLSELLEFNGPEHKEFSRFQRRFPLMPETSNWDGKNFNYALPKDCPSEIPDYLLKAMKEHGVNSDQDYKDFLIDQRYRMATGKELRRPLSAAYHLSGG
jgi:hypothetical protein